MDPLSIIASTLGIVQAISSTYKAIQQLKGLPNEFNEVNRNLPLAQDTLLLARNRLQGLALDGSSKEALQVVVGDCEKKAKMLLEIFEKVEKGVKNSKDGSVLDFYRTSLLRMGKAHRVETLMQGILKGLDALATNQLFRTATESQITHLQEAIDQLAELESSVSDSEFENGSNYQNIASGGTGYQSNITGQDHKINSGSGEQYNVSGSGHTMNFVQSTKHDKIRSDIFEALYTSPYLDRKNRNPDRVPGTCEWFIEHRDFQQWRESKSSSMLWVSANPGSGKSVLAKYLANCELATTQSRTTCYFFFKDDFEDQKSAKSAVSCLLHQLFAQREDLFSNRIIKRFEAYKAQLTRSFDELWEILVMASQDRNAGEVVCILDAFDECEDQERRKFSSALRKFYDPGNDMKTGANLKFLVTSRPYDKIGRGFQPLNIPGLPVIHLKGESYAEVSKIAREIDLFIEDKVSRIRVNLDLTSDEEQLLLKELRQVPNQTYLWVYLTLELLESDININKNKIRDTTSSLPRTVDDAYEKILTKSSNSEEAKKLLHIVVAAARPLTLTEMEFALALRENHSSYTDVDKRPEERFSRYIRDLCGLFVTIIDSKIYLLHQTAKEFLVPKENWVYQGGQNNQFMWKSSLRPSESHRILCQVCIWHLLFTEFETHPLDKYLDKDPDGKVSRYLHKHVFLDYSAKNWAVHFRASGIKDDGVVTLLQQICEAHSQRCMTWFRIYWMNTHTGFPEDFTTLMIASYFGLEQIVKLQLDRYDVKLDSIDGHYERSALSWASENGFDGVVKLLIKGQRITIRGIARLPFRKGARVDTRDKYGRTPLSYAAWNGHMAVVGRLVRAGAGVDTQDKIKGTPISYALCSGHGDVARKLMKGAHIDSVEEIRNELLLSASRYGHYSIVERLLCNGAPAHVADISGRTPLCFAARGGYMSIARLLLENGAVVNPVKPHERVPLCFAAVGGHEDIARLLLDNGADVNVIDINYDERPRFRASNRRLEEFSRLLPDDGANFNGITPRDGTTPLLCASIRGLEAIVRLLLDNGADVNAIDTNNGHTPLSCAAKERHEAIARLLLDNGANVNAINPRDGQTPLSYAAIEAQETIVRLLLDNGANVNAINPRNGRTPLSYAAIKAHETIVRLLLENGANTDIAEHKNYCTPLTYAIERRSSGIVEMLLERGAKVNFSYRYSLDDCPEYHIKPMSPLLEAVWRQDYKVVELLLKYNARPDFPVSDHSTPLQLAEQLHDHTILKMLKDAMQYD